MLTIEVSHTGAASGNASSRYFEKVMLTAAMVVQGYADGGYSQDAMLSASR